jgi:hypothetical protein
MQPKNLDILLPLVFIIIKDAKKGISLRFF